MISVAYSQEYVPFGAKQLLNHPGKALHSLGIEPGCYQHSGPETLVIEKEFWRMRKGNSEQDSVTNEEELYVKGCTAVWSTGSDYVSRKLLKNFTFQCPIQGAIWCTFSPPCMPDPESRDDSNEAVLCLRECTKINIFTHQGAQYFVPLPFQVKSMWPTKFGLLIQRDIHIADKKNLPTLFALVDPLEEITPVLQKQGDNLSNQIACYYCDPNQEIIFASSSPSICVTYNQLNGQHYVWRVRRSSNEENIAVCVDADPLKTLLQQEISTPLTSEWRTLWQREENISQTIDNSYSRPLRSTPVSGAKISVENHPSEPGISDMDSITSSYLSEQPIPSFSSFPSTSKHGSTSFRTFPPLPSYNAHRLFSRSLLEVNIADNPNPLVPDICLDLVWRGEPHSNRDSHRSYQDDVQKAFITEDFCGRQYLGLFSKLQGQLKLLRFETTVPGSDQIIFSGVTTLPVLNAVPLPSLQMMVVIELNHNIVLYTGPLRVSRILIPPSPRLPLTSQNTEKGFPRRSSLIKPGAAPDLDMHFDEALTTLSPVVFGCSGPNTGTVTPYQRGNGKSSHVIGLRDEVDNRVTIHYSNGGYNRIALPVLSTSSLVHHCLTTLSNILPCDIFLHLSVKWYCKRNAPGSSSLSTEAEWDLFVDVILGLTGYKVDKLGLVQHSDQIINTPSPVQAKKRRSSETGSDLDWRTVCDWAHNTGIAECLDKLVGLNVGDTITNTDSQDEDMDSAVDSSAALFVHLPMILYGLHLLYEDMKLDIRMADDLYLLAKLLHHISYDLQLAHYVDHYWRDFPKHCSLPGTSQGHRQVSQSDLDCLKKPSWFTDYPPDIFSSIYSSLNHTAQSSYPYVANVNKKSCDIVMLFAVLAGVSQEENCIYEVRSSCVSASVQELIKSCCGYSAGKLGIAEKVTLLMSKLGIDQEYLSFLPSGISIRLYQVLNICRENPPSAWPIETLILVGRQDQAGEIVTNISKSQKDEMVDSDDQDKRGGELDDGMGTTENEVLKLRYAKDNRVAMVRRMLCSSLPVKICLTQRPDVTDHDLIEEQERHLLALCARTMALPVGRGMFTLNTADDKVVEPLPIPKLCMSGRVPPKGTTVDLTHIEVPANINMWPLFHNGVAAGLAIGPSAENVDNNWIMYNKPKSTTEVPTEHAGFLLALGLNGHLKKLDMLNMYNYLMKCHELTSIGLLLGVAAAKRGTMDIMATKMMSIHLEALLPPTSTELDVVHSVQVAALLGVGLVYQETSHKHIAEVLLSEIGRPPGPEMENCLDRESYSLAAGLGLGLVVFGTSGTVSGLDDLQLPDKLYHYMVGGQRQALTESQHEKFRSPSYQIREGDSVNVDITCPSATLALGMTFFRTGNEAVAKWLDAPDTQYLLDFLRPDFLLLRMISRGLIMWDWILPTIEWVESHVPEPIKKHCLSEPRVIDDGIDYETMNQAQCNILAGACMALGLRFAGSHNADAYDTLMYYAKTFVKFGRNFVAELAGRSTVETCLNVVVLSLSMVMAGSGDYEAVQLCNGLRSRVALPNSVVTYGSHLATHMALGLLFLGGGLCTLSTSRTAVAAMICAFFPKFPTHSNDNKYHLQAFRHLYVLAVEPRLFLPRSLDSSKAVYANLRIVFKGTKWYGKQESFLQAPCILPELDLLSEVRVDDNRYWSMSFQRDKNWDYLKKLLENGYACGVKEKAGSFIKDVLRSSSIFVKSIVQDPVDCWTVKESVQKLSLKSISVCNARSSEEFHVDHLLRVLNLECKQKETPNIMTCGITLIDILLQLSGKHVSPQQCHSLLVWNLKLLSPSTVFMEVFLQSLHVAVEQWENELSSVLQKYLTGGTFRKTDLELLPLLALYLTFRNVPPFASKTAVYDDPVLLLHEMAVTNAIPDSISLMNAALMV